MMIAKSPVRLALFLGVTIGCHAALAQVATSPSPSEQPWSLLYRAGGGVAGATVSLQLNMEEKGLVRYWSRFSSPAAVCFSASRDQVTQLASSIKEVSSAKPSKHKPQRQPIPDMPSSLLELTYARKTFSTDDYAGLPATKRISDIVSQLLKHGRELAQQIKSGNQAPSDSVPCPASDHQQR